MGIVELAGEFVAALAAMDGGAIDPDDERASAAYEALAEANEEARPADRDAALEVLCRRIEAWQPTDAAAYAALVAGELVQAGASAHRLGTTLLPRIPEVLRAARRFADTCLAADPPKPFSLADEEGKLSRRPHELEARAAGGPVEETEPADDAFAFVDNSPIRREVFEAERAADRPGAEALACLTQWMTPTLTVLARDKELLTAATRDPELAEAVAAMRESDAALLQVLLQTRIDEVWLVLCPLVERGFEVLVDGVADNFTLHALLAGALLPLGVPGGDDGTAADPNPPGMYAYLRGDSPGQPADRATLVWNLYDYRAAGRDLSQPVEQDCWVWGEGLPIDVPAVDGVRTLLLGPPTYQRTWGSLPMFEGMRRDVRMLRELPEEEVRAALDRLAAAARTIMSKRS